MNSETPKPSRKWYQKKRYLLPIGVISLAALISSGNDGSQVKSQVAPTQTVSGINTIQSSSYIPVQQAPVTPTSSNLSNDNYYTNVNGNTVHSPAYSNSVPSGASAICGDGTYSFSQNHRGTCSHHGGVDEWL